MTTGRGAGTELVNKMPLDTKPDMGKNPMPGGADVNEVAQQHLFGG
ncbi:hypothetical protein OF385_14250 [Glutamicibacter sp. JL.03c]|nr:hypothetical protein [Glutamicibacter sp. JL.03c]UYQ77167.1 hypothetical protein OF385_14250 [Glutamicibacter sp. JL.03c]